MAITPRLLQTETVKRVRPDGRVTDGQGGWQPGPDVVTVMEGAVQPLTLRDALIARQQGSTVTHVGFFAWDADWVRGDRLVAVDRGFEAEVIGVRRSSKPGHHLRINLEERQPS